MANSFLGNGCVRVYSKENAFLQKMMNRTLVGKIMNFSNVKKRGGTNEGKSLYNSATVDSDHEKHENSQCSILSDINIESCECNLFVGKCCKTRPLSAKYFPEKPKYFQPFLNSNIFFEELSLF